MNRTLARVCLTFCAAALSVFGVAGVANAQEEGVTYEPFAKVTETGSLEVKVDLTFPQASPEYVTQVFAKTKSLPDDYEQRYTITDVKVETPNVNFGVAEGANILELKLQPNGAKKVTFSYIVSGAATKLADGSVDISWPLLQGLSVPVASFDAMVVPGAPFTLVDCAAGNPQALGGCGYFGGGTEESQIPVFHDSARAPGEMVVFTLRYAKDSMATNANIVELWNLERAFSLEPAPLGTALGILVLGGLIFFAVHRRFGYDAQSKATPTVVAEFHPVGPGASEFRVLDDVRPGHVGTVLDERVDPTDVVATLLDLAVRGHLEIRELPKDNPYAQREWNLTRKASDDKLAQYEETLLDAIGAEGETLPASNIGQTVYPLVGKVQSELYADVTERGWFRGRPDVTRSRWFLGSIAGAVIATLVTIGLVAWTHFGITGLVLMILSVGLMFVAQVMPAKTEAGASLANGLDVLRGQLLTAPTNQMPEGRAYHELSEVLPYAVVLGGYDRWLAGLVEADTDDDPDGDVLSWYKAPDDWHLRDLPNSMSSFILMIQGRLYSR